MKVKRDRSALADGHKINICLTRCRFIDSERRHLLRNRAKSFCEDVGSPALGSRLLILDGQLDRISLFQGRITAAGTGAHEMPARVKLGPRVGKVRRYRCSTIPYGRDRQGRAFDDMAVD